MFTFTTVIGPVGISWTENGINSVVLGCKKRSSITQPPAWVRAAIKKIVKHLKGTTDSLKDIKIDLSSCPAFHREVYRALRRVRPGKVTTYGELASKVGRPGAARAVGSAMAKNPVSLIVPCHRVVKSDGSLGQFTAPAGPSLKRRLLDLEGVDL